MIRPRQLAAGYCQGVMTPADIEHTASLHADPDAFKQMVRCYVLQHRQRLDQTRGRLGAAQARLRDPLVDIPRQNQLIKKLQQELNQLQREQAA